MKLAAPTLVLPGFDQAVPMFVAHGPVESDAFLDACANGSAVLPARVRTALAELRSGIGPETLLLRGVAVGTLPATPPRPDSPVSKDSVSELALLTVARALGEPVGYLPEHGGRIVQNLVPVRETATLQVSTSSAVTLAFHTETAFHPHKPRFLLLLCLRGDPSASTTVCTARAALDALAPETVATLRRPIFRTRPDRSFLSEGAVAEPGPLMAVVAGPSHEPTFTFDEELMSSDLPDGRAALKDLADAVRAQQFAVVLEQGDLLVIDNHRVVHGRSPFAARFDGTDRWLQRSFVVTDLAPSSDARVGRVITTQFGSTPAA